MPLHDHFTPPVPPRAAWQSFHHRWAGVIADHLDATLPPQFFARVEVNLGTEVAADVAEFEEPTADHALPTTYTPPAPVHSWPLTYPDDAAVEVRTTADGGRLVAVVELVSPANKDRPAARAGFAAKCAGYLNAGVGLVVVDVVHDRRLSLHAELAALLGQPADDTPTYATAYRPTAAGPAGRVDVWWAALAVGRPLPTVPLALRGRGCFPLDLEALYTETCRRARITPLAVRDAT